MNPDEPNPTPEPTTPNSPTNTPTPPTNTSLNDILNLAKQKGEEIRSQPKSVDNLAKSAWQNSTGIRKQVKRGLNTAYTILTGLTNPEVRTQLKGYINKIQPPLPRKKTPQ